jgi:hypothetical protein
LTSSVAGAAADSGVLAASGYQTGNEKSKSEQRALVHEQSP